MVGKILRSATDSKDFGSEIYVAPCSNGEPNHTVLLSQLEW